MTKILKRQCMFLSYQAFVVNFLYFDKENTVSGGRDQVFSKSILSRIRAGDRMAAFVEERTDYSSVRAWARLPSVAPLRSGLRTVLPRDGYSSTVFLIMYFVNKEDRRKVTFPLVDYAELEGAN
jgi:hypothetical protein